MTPPAEPRESLLAFLERHPFFAGLTPHERARLAPLFIHRRYVPGTLILSQGEAAGAVYFVARGQVRISRFSSEGREQALMDVLPGGVFNAVAAVDAGPAPSNAAARTHVELYVLPREDFLFALRTYPSIAEAVLRDFAGRLRRLTGLVEDLSLRTVAGRLARLLLEMSSEPGPARRFTHQELAVRIGTVREVVSRTMRGFEQDGLIKMDRHRIIILDRERLAEIAGEV